MREAISKHSGLPLENRGSLREKIAYNSIVKAQKDEIEVDGQTYTYQRTKQS